MLRVFLALATMTVLLLGSSAAEANRLPKILPPPDVPWPEGGKFSVFLCGENDAWDACGDEEVTSEQRYAVEQRLRKIPRLADFHYRDKVDEWTRMVEESPELRAAIEVNDMPEGFHGRLLRWSDANAFDSVTKALPGVSNTYVLPDLFWRGKADVSITLCDTSGEYELCKGRGSVTATERAVIESLLRRTKGVKRIYFADLEHDIWAAKEFMARWSQVTGRDSQNKDDDTEPRPLEKYSGTYYVKLDDPKQATSVMDTVKGLTGVAQVNKEPA
ncbi:permease-like cell division protein FtsX [Streptosporangium sp. NPDC050855]|uniref:permease-like cell division protein FtsX n=1 Tax=Streptosporangium sp. NPDC050855 TaxID=3366194 RepID=UPI0037A0F623